VHDSDKMDAFIDTCLNQSLAIDGVRANSITESAYMWKLRDEASLAIMRDGYVYKSDISLPIVDYYRLTEHLRERVSKIATRIITFGHLGDGNVHLNVSSREFSRPLYDK
jgi:D-2-hydroxyglutarate dehydrogenase